VKPVKKFFPDLWLTSVFEISFADLRRDGVTALIFDIDNTLAAFDDPEPSARVAELFDNLKRMGFSICLLSNNGEARVKRFNEKLGAFTVFKAGKPRKTAAEKALAWMGVKAGDAVLIGDQLFTDVLCGKNAGVFTILVKPLTNRDEITVVWKRPLEKIVLWRYKIYLKRKASR